VQLEGDVILPESRGRAKITVSGGGLGAGREGKFELTSHAALTDPKVTAIEVRGDLVATMDTPRSFTRIAARLDTTATGTQFPAGVKLLADVAASRAATGESYAAAVVADGHEILNLRAALPPNALKIDGTWKIDVRHADVAPFTLGVPLPGFGAVGEGKFDTDANFAAIHVMGRLNTTVERLRDFLPRFAALPELQMAADFDLAGRSGTIAVQKFEVAITATLPVASGSKADPKPIATVRTLQAFEFNPAGGEVRPVDITRELLGVTLQGAPLSWAAPFLQDIEFDEAYLRGELVASARGGGVTLRSTSPLVAEAVTVTQLGKRLVQNVTVSLNTSADYTSLGWQAEVSNFAVKSDTVTLLMIEGKAGQLAGKNQALKATGKLAANLPGLLAQPLSDGSIKLTGGDAAADFVISLNATNEVQAHIALTNLATQVEKNVVTLPTVSINLRADLAANGKIAFNAPIVIERNDRKSDVTVIGTIAPEKDKLRAIDAEATSTQLVIDDAQVLAAMFRKTDRPPSSTTPPRDAAPPWAGLSGSLTLHLKNVIYSDAFQVNNVAGRVRIDAGMLKLEGLQAGLGETGRANVNGKVTFEASEPQPYMLAADVSVKEFDPGPLFRASSGNPPATLEGKFDLTSKLAAHASTFGDLATGAGGTFQITSKGGVFRGLPVSVSKIAETTGRIAAWIASAGAAAGTAISAITGKKDTTDIANKAEAIAEVARALNPIQFDQLSVVLSRDAALNTTLKNFTLIAPEVRLSGGGTALHKPGGSLLEDSLAMEFTLRARGRQGELLKYLGALDAQTDDLGYAACTVPLKVTGTLGKPDTSELNSKLAALALEKSGFGDKAAELISKIRGGK